MEIKKNIFGIVLLCLVMHAHAHEVQQSTKNSEQSPLYSIVTQPVVDVRSQPTKNRHDIKNRHDLYQTTQLLLGERVIVHEKKGSWARISIPDQLVASGQNNTRLFPCPGWVEDSALTPCTSWASPAGFINTTWVPVFDHQGGMQAPRMYLSMGTPLRGFRTGEMWWKVHLPNQKIGWVEARYVTPAMSTRPQNKKALRRELIKRATLAVGYPYVLGGRSMYNPHKGFQRTSVDCSSLIQLVYQSHGIKVPRNAPAQYHAARKISGEHCKPGDLIFLAYKNNPTRIFHVMLYLGNNHILEASGDQMKVRVISCVQKIGSTIHSLKNGAHVGPYVVYFGKLL